MSIDIHAAGFLKNPGPLIAKMHDAGGLIELKLPILGRVWATVSYEDTKQVLKDTETFCRNPKNAGNPSPERQFWWAPRFVRPLFKNVTLMDGEEHARLRGLVQGAFATHRIKALEPRLEDIVQTLLSKLPTDTPVDLVENYDRKLPLLAICELLGIPESDRADVIRWVAPVGQISSIPAFFRAAPGLWKLSRHFRADFEGIRRAGGRPGLIGDLVNIHDDDPNAMTDDELLAMTVALFIGGFDTTTHLIGNSIFTLLQKPSLRDDLNNTPELWPRFIEEVMRFHSPVMFTNVFHVQKPVAIGGQRLKRGDKIIPLLIAANRDATMFEDADEFMAKRKLNRHVGFGMGSHMCLGMQLARAEARLATRLFFERFPNARLETTADDVPPLHRLGFHAVEKLVVRLD